MSTSKVQKIIPFTEAELDLLFDLVSLEMENRSEEAEPRPDDDVAYSLYCKIAK